MISIHNLNSDASWNQSKLMFFHLVRRNDPSSEPHFCHQMGVWIPCHFRFNLLSRVHLIFRKIYMTALTL